MSRRSRRAAPPAPAPPPGLWAGLPSDILVRVVLLGRSAPALVHTLMACSAWRAALAADVELLWRTFALADFPRLHDITKLKPPPAMPGAWRDIYRSQSLARTKPLSISPAPPLRRLNDYVLTVEVSAPGTTVASRSKVLELNDFDELGDVELPLWDSYLQRPAWFNFQETKPESLMFSILVTFEHRTIRLYDEGVLKRKFPTSRGGGSSFYEHLHDQELPFASRAALQAFPQDCVLTGASRTITLRPWVDISCAGFDQYVEQDELDDEDWLQARPATDTIRLELEMHDQQLAGYASDRSEECFLMYLQALPWNEICREI